MLFRSLSGYPMVGRLRIVYDNFVTHAELISTYLSIPLAEAELIYPDLSISLAHAIVMNTMLSK